MENNPYQQPSADLVQGQTHTGELTVNAPRARDIGAGWRWFTDAWRIFKSAWGTIFLAMIVAWLLSMAAQFVPVLGIVLSILIAPFLSAGMAVLCYNVDEQRGATVGNLFTPFSTHLTPLIVVGLLYFGLFVAAVLVGGLIGYLLLGDVFSGLIPDADAIARGAGPDFMSLTLFGLIIAALMIPVMAAYWFAPALVVLGNERPVAALKGSLKGCLKNILPMLWYSVIMVVLFVVGLIPFGLGLLVVLPIMMVTYYSSFRDIYTDTL